MWVHIVDDDDAFGRTIGRSVAHAGWSFSRYASAETFLSQIGALPYGCVILDIKMPGMGGVELLELLQIKCPEWPVVMMSGDGELAEAIRSFRQGAIHFLVKPFQRNTLLAVLEEAAQVGELRKVEAARQREALLVKQLSQRETQVLRGLADGSPSKVIAWELGISPRTVEMHRSNILTKLGARNTSQAAAIANRSAALLPRKADVGHYAGKRDS